MSCLHPERSSDWSKCRAADEDRPGPRRVLDNDYEIKPCPADPGEDPAKNKADAERQSRMELQFNS